MQQLSQKLNINDGNHEGQNIYEQIIKLDQMNSNFELIDNLHSTKLKIKYNHCSNIKKTSKDNQNIKKAFWQHIHNFYFKQIEQNQISRLDYLNLILNDQIKDSRRIYYNSQAYQQIDEIINQQYFKNKTDNQQLHYQNILKHLFLDFAYVDALRLNDKKLVAKTKNYINQKDKILFKRNTDYLTKENNRLDEITKLYNNQLKINQLDELQNQLNKQKKQLKSLNLSNKQGLKKLKKKIQFQTKNKIGTNSNPPLKIDIKNLKSDHQKLLNQNDRQEIILKYLKKCILKLDRLQIAESISKITQTYKKSANQYSFLVKFQKGLNLEDYVFTQQQLISLNKIRQHSLFKYYNIGLKSLYTTTSHNYIGLGQILKNRKDVTISQNNLLESMKKMTYQSQDINQKIKQFDMCHHCRQLYHSDYLVSCNYKSTKLINSNISYVGVEDSYFYQFIQKNQNVSNPNRLILNSKKNLYLTHTKRKNQYFCDRKFCKLCLHNSYSSVQKNGLCPYCQEECFCTRCIRNENIIKLKILYSLFNGNINQLYSQSLFEKVFSRSLNNNQKEQNNKYLRNTIEDKKRRSKLKSEKQSIYKTKLKAYYKMSELKLSMAQSQLICHLVKKRQKQKLFLIQQRNQLFNKKVDLLKEQKSNPHKRFYSELGAAQESDKQNNIQNIINENRKMKLKKLR